MFQEAHNVSESTKIFMRHKMFQEAHQEVGRRVARLLQSQPPVFYQRDPGANSYIDILR